MDQTNEELLSRALELSVCDRAEFAAKLLESLEAEEAADVEAAWAAEIQRRIARVRRGEAKLEEWDAVKLRLRQ